MGLCGLTLVSFCDSAGITVPMVLVMAMLPFLPAS